MRVLKRMITDTLSSESSGNDSENDQINKIYQLQKNYEQEYMEGVDSHDQ